MKFEFKFDMFDVVAHKLSLDAAGMITGMTIRRHAVLYLVTWGEELKETAHYEEELELYEERTIGGLGQ